MEKTGPGNRLQEDLEYYMEQIRETDRHPYQMSNRCLAEALFGRVKKEYPDAEYFTYGILQWIVVSGAARCRLAVQLRRMEEIRTGELDELKKIIKEVEDSVQGHGAVIPGSGACSPERAVPGGL